MPGIQLGPTNAQRETNYARQIMTPDSPYQAVWWLHQAPSQASQLRLIPDLSLHLIFDLAGILTIEPILLDTSASFVDFVLPVGSELIGLQFALWEARWLREGAARLPASWSISFDIDWANLIYYQLLDARNAGLDREETLQQVAQFRDGIDESLRGDFDTHFVEVAENPSAASALAYSERHQRRLYHELTGMAPRQFRRIARFQQTLQTLLAERRLDWEGYFDQAHCIREFKALSGMTPTAILKQYRT